jgi:hypothetical protein
MRGIDKVGSGSARSPPAHGPTRRRVLTGCAAGLVALAGCSDDGDGGDDAGAGAGTPTEEDAGGVGAETATDDAADAETATDTDAATGGDGGDRQGFREAVRFEESFAMSGTFQENGQTGEFDARFDGADLYWRFETDQGVVETHRVGGDFYVVSDGQCFRNPGQEFGVEGIEPQEFESSSEELPDAEPSGTTTIDGETMLVYEFESGAVDGVQGAATYYVSAETGYVRRVETGSGVLNFHSWGAVDPVTAPDMNCRSN